MLEPDARGEPAPRPRHIRDRRIPPRQVGEIAALPRTRCREAKRGVAAGSQLARRSRTTTRAPRAGIIVTLRCRACSGAGSSAREVRAPGDRLEHHALLGHGQRGAQAAADAAAERDPRRRCRACGRRSARAGRRTGRGRRPRGGARSRMLISTGVSGRDAVLAELPRHGHAAADDRDHRAGERIASWIVASTYLVGVARPSADRVAQPVVGGGRAHEALERPRQRVGRRLVAGEHEREQLVAQLAVGERLAVLVARLQQQREDVGARPRGRAAPRRARDDRVGRAVEHRERRARAARAARRWPMFMSSATWATGRVDSQTSRADDLAQPVLGRARGRARPRCRRSRP